MNSTMLTTQIGREIVAAVYAGNSLNVACAQVGVDISVVNRWIERGNQGERPFKDFCEALDEADPFKRDNAFSEIALATMFVDQHHHEARYVADMKDRNKWFVLIGGCWEHDLRGQVSAWAREIAAAASTKCANRPKSPKWLAHRLASYHTVRAIVDLARSDPRIVALGARRFLSNQP